AFCSLRLFGGVCGRLVDRSLHRLADRLSPGKRGAATTIGFLSLVGERAVALDKEGPPFTDARSAADELQRLLVRLRAAINESDHLAMHRQLVTLLAHGCRLARDLGIETENDAVAKDDA